MAVEIDGPVHESLVQQDNDRQKKLESNGVVFFRVTSEEVENASENVLARLKKFIETINGVGKSPSSRPFSHTWEKGEGFLKLYKCKRNSFYTINSIIPPPLYRLRERGRG